MNYDQIYPETELRVADVAKLLGKSPAKAKALMEAPDGIRSWEDISAQSQSKSGRKYLVTTLQDVRDYQARMRHGEQSEQAVSPANKIAVGAPVDYKQLMKSS